MWVFGIVRELGFENVFYGGGVGGDDVVDFVGVEEDGGVGGVVGEDVGGLVQEVVVVEEEVGEGIEEWVYFEVIGGLFGEEEEEKNER